MALTLAHLHNQADPRGYVSPNAIHCSSDCQILGYLALQPSGTDVACDLCKVYLTLFSWLATKWNLSAYLFLTPFSTIFIAQLTPLSLLSPYVSLYDLYDLDVFPYNADTHTPFPLILLTTIRTIPRTRSIGSQLWTT